MLFQPMVNILLPDAEQSAYSVAWQLSTLDKRIGKSSADLKQFLNLLNCKQVLGATSASSRSLCIAPCHLVLIYSTVGAF